MDLITLALAKKYTDEKTSPSSGGGSEPFIVFKILQTGESDSMGNTIYDYSINVPFAELLAQLKSGDYKPAFALTDSGWGYYTDPMSLSVINDDCIGIRFTSTYEGNEKYFEFNSDGTIVKPEVV